MKLLITPFLFFLVACGDNRSPETPVARTTEAQVESGRQLYFQNCIKCHGGPGKHIDPPFFDGLFNRLPAPTETYFVDFVSDSKKLKAAGDRYAVNLDSAWFNADYEHAFGSTFSQQDFANLVAYMKKAANH